MKTTIEILKKKKRQHCLLSKTREIIDETPGSEAMDRILTKIHSPTQKL
jgi:hypothetical protein